MEYQNLCSCPACQAGLCILTDKEVYRRTAFILPVCPACGRKICVVLCSGDGVQMSISDKEPPQVLEVLLSQEAPPLQKVAPVEPGSKDLPNEPSRPAGTALSSVPSTQPLPPAADGPDAYKVKPIEVAPVAPERLPYVRAAIRGMVFGIVATICGALAWFPAVGFVYGVLGLTFGLIAFISGIRMKAEFKRNPHKYRPSSAKLIRVSFALGLTGLILSFFMSLLCIATTMAVYD